MQPFFKHQIDFLKQNPDKTALVWSCGTGKSRTAVEWSKSKDNKTLIICPKPLFANWNLEVKKWNGVADVITKEQFRTNHKTLGKYDQLIIDEVHNGFLTPHFKSQMSKALRWYLKTHSINRILLLSATVYSSSPWNIYQLATILGYKWNWFAFSQTFFNQVRMGPRIVPVAKKGIEPKLAELTKRIASVVNIYDCMDVPLQQHCEPEYFALTKEQVKGIEEAYDPLPIVRYTMQHEIENGILLANEFRKLKTYENYKIERIKAICEENKKVAIVCRYNSQLEEYKKNLAKYRPEIINGAERERDAICRRMESSDEAVLLIQADCAEGYELPSFPVCVFASMSYSYVKFEQICGRFLRMNKPSRTTFMYLLTEGDSLDLAVYQSVKRKEDFNINLYKR